MLLATLTDADLGYPYTLTTVTKHRTACRAFLFDDQGNLACLWSETNRQHKLPGGGVEGAETLEQALVREMHEEAGCAVHNITYLGYLDEFRAKDDGFHQTSHLYVAHVHGAKGQPAFDANEIAHGFALKWVSPQQFSTLLTTEAGSPDYGLNFQNARERKLLTFLPQ